MSVPGIDVDREALIRAAEILEGRADSLDAEGPTLRQQPDAGASSHEVATAMAAFAGAVSGLGQHLRSVADVTRGAAEDFTVTDQGVHGAFQRGGVTP